MNLAEWSGKKCLFGEGYQEGVSAIEACDPLM